MHFRKSMATAIETAEIWQNRMFTNDWTNCRNTKGQRKTCESLGEDDQHRLVRIDSLIRETE